MREAPVGREAAWRRLISQLESRKSGLVLIAGQPGTGRSYLLRAVGDAARDLGFTVIGSNEPMAIDPTMKVRDVRRILAAMLGDGDVGGGSGKQAVFDFLDQAAPAVLLIDGLMPSTKLSTWFTKHLIPHVLASCGPVIVFVADQLKPMAALCDLAADVIEIGPLDRDAVARHLREAGADLRPPLSDEEVAAYCDAVTQDVGLLTPLDMVLSVLAEDTGRQSAEALSPASSAARQQDGMVEQ